MDQLLQGGNFQYTQDELKALENAMKQKEFRDLLVEYVEEISDPKNKEEYDQYLRQLEGQQELPKGMKLIQPTACFCLKTKIKSKKNPKSTQKLFINICMAPDLEKPTQEKDKKNKDNVKGQQWHIPYSINKLRMDQDKDKNVCQTTDVAFNPLTFEFCRKTEAFKKMICEISIEAASKQIKDADEIVSKDYKILNRMKCKGGQPAVMPVRLNAQPGDHDEALPPGATQRNEDYAPKLYQEFMKQQKDFKQDQQKETVQKAQQNSHIVELASKDFETIPEKAGEQEEEDTKKNVIAPKYSIVHSYGVDYADFLMAPPEQGKKRPKQLVIKIDLPRVEKMKEIELDINEKNLVLKAANKYYLDISLPFKIASDEGGAKFDSKTKTLTVTLPTVQEDEPEQKQENGETVEEVENQDETEENNDNRAQNEENGALAEGSNKESALRFVSEESGKRYKEEQEKILQKLANHGKENHVEELASTETSEHQQPTKAAPKVSEKQVQKVVNRNFEFKTQQTHENYFFIFNVPDYQKEAVKVALLDNEVLIRYEDEKRELSNWITALKSYDTKASQVSFVKDFVVVNLKKTEDGFWEEDAWRKESYNEEFNNKLRAYEEEQKAQQEAQKQEAVQNGEVQQDSKEGNEDETQEKTEQDEEIEEDDVSKKDEQNIEERFVEKRSINFINFGRNNIAFHLD